MVPQDARQPAPAYDRGERLETVDGADHNGTATNRSPPHQQGAAGATGEWSSSGRPGALLPGRPFRARRAKGGKGGQPRARGPCAPPGTRWAAQLPIDGSGHRFSHYLGD
jgi:hypothetical protein